MTDNAEQTPPIVDRFQLESAADIDRYNERNRHQVAANDTADSERRDQATTARQALAATSAGAAMLARLDAIRAGSPDAETAELAELIAHAERSAEATAEAYNLDAARKWPALAGLAMNTPFLMELQKVAADTRYRLAALHTVNAQGEKPTAETVNPVNGELLTSVTVYSASRPHTRFVLGPSQTFVSTTAQLAEDVHCDFAEHPYLSALAQHKTRGKPDCVAELAEHVAIQRTQHENFAKNMRDYPPASRDRLTRPDPISVGAMLAVAFSNDIVVLKFCTGHALALLDKYGIDPARCGIEEPWEGIGNYW
ncbi:hypothetical protein B1R94_07840 [Mycolicibacterium litorale]|nr:hypothetical protein B1R94_07840 [Mycolicibacterium litorale]